MKTILLIVTFISLVALGIFGIPEILKQTLEVEQPMLTVVSSSMWPELSRGDIVFVKKTTPEEIQVGSVIVFRHEHGLTVHRVVRIDSRTITTKGDANPVADNPISFDDVVGRIPTIGSKLLRIPWIGYFSLLPNPEAGDPNSQVAEEPGVWEQLTSTILSPLGIVIIIGVPLLVIFYNPIMSFLSGLLPISERKRRQKLRVKRLENRWHERHAGRTVRI
jgi:signal peptidase I